MFFGLVLYGRKYLELNNKGNKMKKFLLASLLILSTTLSASTTRVLDGQSITNGSAVLTLPTSTDTLTGKNTTDILTNKSISGATNTLTAIPTSAIAGSALSGTNSGDVTIGTANGLSLSGQALSLQAATASVPGALLAADFTIFAAKLTSSLTSTHLFVGNGSGVATDVALSGDATLANTGALTIGAKKIQASKLDSGAATSGYLATADGSGGVTYAAPPSVAPAISGTYASPNAITAGGGVSFSGAAYSNIQYVAGSGGAVTVTANPQIAAGVTGQFLTLISTSATNTVTLADGTGLLLNGSWVGGLNSSITLQYTGAAWLEVSRR